MIPCIFMHQMELIESTSNLCEISHLEPVIDFT